jgi:C-terminal processing protease CtpA/Prc
MLIAQRFMSVRQHVYSKQARLGSGRTPLIDVYLDPLPANQYLGPIVILSSASTVSAAEVFILAIRNLPNVTIVGESTQGAFSDVSMSRVTSDIVFGFSNEYYLSRTGEWFEHQGIPVDIEVPFLTLEQREQERDYAIEEALRLLQ